jgi:16S rRNA (cytosine967-C5)-methyltransferase
MTLSSQVNTREVATRILMEWREHGQYPDRLMRDLARDRAFIMEMVYGVLRHRSALEWMIERMSHHQQREDKSNPLIPLLCIGLYQLFFMDHVVSYAAVNETVDAAKKLFTDKEASFVNALLRRALRERERWLEELERKPLSIRYSHPEWLVERWVSRYGAYDTARLCVWNNERSRVTLRIRPMLSPEAYLAVLKKLNIEARIHPVVPTFLVLPTGVAVDQLPGYKEGWFTVQDPATSNAVAMLDPKKGERVLDLCAAPGGKTILMADRMSGAEGLTALDNNPDRLRILRENLDRCGLSQVHVVQADACALTPEDFSAQGFDAILLDAPCSNSGVLQRRPDARWRLTPGSIQEIGELQTALLHAAASLLRPGGRLVYSTCSLEDEENETQVRAFLDHHPLFHLVSQNRTFPPRDGVDGAYAALIHRDP